MTLEVVIRFVVLSCHVATIPKHGLQTLQYNEDYYSICIVIKFKPEKSSTQWNVQLFSAQVLDHSLSPPGFFYSAAVFFFLWLHLHQVKWLLPPSCLSTHDTTDAASGYCGNGEWQQSGINEEEKLEGWLSCMAESLADLWPVCWINHLFCLMLFVTDVACEIAVNKWTRECGVIWVHREVQASESPSCRNESRITYMYESRSTFYYD